MLDPHAQVQADAGATPSSRHDLAPTDARARLVGQLGAAVRRIPIVAVFIAVGAASGYFYANRQTPNYESEASVIVGSALQSLAVGLDDLMTADELAKTYAAIATTPDTLSSVADDVQLPPGTDLSKLVSVAADANIITITARDVDSERAAQIANTMARILSDRAPGSPGRVGVGGTDIDIQVESILTDIDSTQRSVRQLEAIENRTALQDEVLTSLRADLADLRANLVALLPYTSANATNIVTLLQSAEPSSTNVALRPTLAALLGAALGLGLGIAFVLMMRLLDDRIRGVSALERLGVRVVGQVQDSSLGGDAGGVEVTTFARATARASDQYRSIRHSVRLGSEIRAVLVLGITSDDSSPTLSTNLAVSLASAGQEAILVDADLQSRRLSRMFGVADQPGLREAIEVPAQVQSIFGTYQPRLSFIPAGASDGTLEAIGAPWFLERWRDLRNDADALVLSGGPLAEGSQPLSLLPLVDGVLLVVENNRDGAPDTMAAVRQISDAGGAILGIVLYHRRFGARGLRSRRSHRGPLLGVAGASYRLPGSATSISTGRP